jgi:hypothetical protein
MIELTWCDGTERPGSLHGSFGEALAAVRKVPEYQLARRTPDDADRWADLVLVRGRLVARLVDLGQERR